MRWLRRAIHLIIGALLISIASAEETRPNVILILVDDFGRETIGALGGESYQTPNIDQLAADGITFEVCYATPMCSPTRNMLLSGQYNFRNYTAWGEYRFGDHPTIANTLAKAGYNTAVTGKWHLGGWDKNPFGPTRAGFHRYATFNYPEQLDEDDEGIANFFWNTNLREKKSRNATPKFNRIGKAYSPAHFRDFSLEFIEDHAGKETPFFLYYPMILAHRPFTPTDLSEDDGIEHRGRNGDKANFPEMVTYIDNTLGAIRQKLEETGQSVNTLVIFTADNGTDNVSDAKELRSKWKGQTLKGGKYVPTERGANVPFFATWPGKIKPGTIYKKATDFTDFHVTLAKLAEAEMPKDLDGHDLTPVFLGEGDSTREYAYTWGVHEYSSKKYKTPVEYRAELLHILRDERWKYQSDNTLWDLQAGWPQGDPIPRGEQKEVRECMRTALRALRQSQPKLW